jgi:hypothetical protein
MPLGSAHDQGQRDSTRVDEKASLRPIFFPGPLGSAQQIPVPAEPLPWPRRCFARTMQSLPSRHTPPGPCARASQILLSSSTLESTCAQN